jgi:hypothetical protein
MPTIVKPGSLFKGMAGAVASGSRDFFVEGFGDSIDILVLLSAILLLLVTSFSGGSSS